MKEQSLFEEASRCWDAGDLKRAFALFRKAAQGGDLSCFSNLGFFYDEGLGTAVDKEAAGYWYRKAAMRKDFSGANNLAIWHLERGNHRRGRYWLRRLVQWGDGDAALHLAELDLKKPGAAARKRASAYLREALQAPHTTLAAKEQARALLYG